MRRILVISLLYLFVVGVVLSAAELPPDIKKKHEQMLYPVVRVTSGDVAGSGTIIYSEDRGDGCQTYVLTNHHVIENAIKITTVWSSLLQADVKRESNDEVKVEIFRYTEGSRQDFADSCSAEIVAHSKEHDLALLRLKTTRKLDFVAKFPSETQFYIFQPIWAIGCSLRLPPVATEGIITYMDGVIDQKLYWSGSASIVYGNSGGAVYTKFGDNYYFIGVPTRVSGAGWQIFPHMGWFAPLPRIKEWITDEKLDFLIVADKKPTECFELREKLRKEREAQLNKKDSSK